MSAAWCPNCEVPVKAVWRYCPFCGESLMSAGNPTERPEERDSLPTWDELDLLVDTDPLALRDLARTLINEVKELREESRFLALRLKDAGEARETFEGMYRNAESECWRWRTLAEESRAERKQMEEALRGAREHLVDLEEAYDTSDPIVSAAVLGLRAALSPSDTEKPRRPRIAPATGRVTR